MRSGATLPFDAAKENAPAKKNAVQMRIVAKRRDRKMPDAAAKRTAAASHIQRLTETASDEAAIPTQKHTERIASGHGENSFATFRPALVIQHTPLA